LRLRLRMMIVPRHQLLHLRLAIQRLLDRVLEL
jgi:hypothetical protein